MRPIFSNLSIQAACDFTESHVKVIQALSDGRIISAVDLPSKGIVDGKIQRVDQFSEVLWQATHEVERQSGFLIKSLSMSMDDSHLQSFKVQGSSHTDIGSEGFEKKHIKEAELHALQALAPNDLKLVYQKEAGYLIDHKDYLQNPIGICGHELTVVLHLLFSDPAYAQNIQFAVERTGRSLKGIYPSALACWHGTQRNEDDAKKEAIGVINHSSAHFAIFQNGAIQTYQSILRSNAEPKVWFENICEKIKHLFVDVLEIGLVGELLDDATELNRMLQQTHSKCVYLKPKYLHTLPIPTSFSAAYGAILLDNHHYRSQISRYSSQFKNTFVSKAKQFVYEYFG